ncbi:MAG: ABC transporter ATP-binding protein, partial [bacterium]|nr:ABC transporter ATP-binding protein [bacterium]
MELKLVHLVKEFGSYETPEERVVAVDTVDLHVEEGELVTLLGPSGCGKTTLLRMISGFEDPTSGDIFFGNTRINDVAPNKRNSTLVFQSYAIFPHLDVFENIAFGLRLKHLTEHDIQEHMARVLDLVGLSGLERRAPSQLSGGQQQRVALARAIIMEPQLLLFDEPLSNLDAKLREQMRIEIRQLQQRLKITSVYVTHDQLEAMSISDRVVVMNRGRIEQVGTPLDLYAHPVNYFVADFIGKADFLPAQVVAKGKVRILDREFTLPTLSETCSIGTELQLMIRPEAIQLVPQEQDA